MDGWDINQEFSDSQTVEEFLNDIRKMNTANGADFAEDEVARERIRAVFDSLRKYVSDGELIDILSELPKEVVDLVLS